MFVIAFCLHMQEWDIYGVQDYGTEGRLEESEGSRLRIICSIAVSLTIGFAAVCPAAEPMPRSVLLLDQGYVGSPWYDAYSNAFRSAFVGSSAAGVAINVEHLDFGHFSGPEQDNILRAYLQGKYRNSPINVIVAAGPKALEFALHVREELGSNIPVVFSVVDTSTLARLRPSNATGHILQYTLRDQITSARALVPDLQHVALVGDPLETQSFMDEFRRELPIFSAQLDFIDLTGLSLQDVKKRVADLPENSAIVYTAINVDGAGVSYIPRDALVAIAEVANRPIVIDSETMLGYGGTGGFVASPTALAQQTAQLALRVLNGEDPSTIPASIDELKPIFDWQQLKHWHVSEHRLPPGSAIYFREPTAWQRYSWQIALITAVILAQTGLISALLNAHRRRRLAEVQSRQRMAELAHVNRFSTAGELTASIAHEINQPLGAILTNAETAQAILKSPSPDIAELNEIVGDIVRDDRRATEVIRRMRSLLKKAPFELKTLDLNDLVRETVEFLSALAIARKFELVSVITEDALPILGDRIQLQQVILNLVVNGIDAMKDTPSENRIISIRTSRVETFAQLSVSDRGSGISEDKLKEIFEPFFTSKSGGMGMGLSIARTIVEAHEGQIWAENPDHGGASFRIRLPLKERAA
jgi:signal transduction histidine kinase